MELTERILNDAGGWQAMKAARAMHEAGRVTDATWEPPLLRGRVREGSTEFRAGLKISSRTDIENLCTCRVSRQQGQICGHALAVGLEHLRPQPKKAPSTDDARNLQPQTSSDQLTETAENVVRGSRGRIFTIEAAPTVGLAIVLPPNLETALGRPSLSLVVEAEMAGKRMPFPALPPDSHYGCDSQDLQIVRRLVLLGGGDLPAAVTLSHADFAGFLPLLKGHPRVTAGRMGKVSIASETRRLTIVGRAEAGGDLHLSLDILENCILLYTRDFACVFTPPAGFSVVAEGLPPAYHSLLRGEVTIPAAGVASFHEREVPLLANFFDLQLPNSPPVSASKTAAEPAAPKLFLKLEGSLNHLAAELQSELNGRSLTLTSTTTQPRNRAEAAALQRLQSSGFESSGRKGEWVLKGEPAILRFFAAALPALQREWRVEIGARFEHVTSSLERIEPNFEVRGSGHDWFELSLELTTASGERFSATEIKRLLRSGQTAIRTKGQKRAVFNPELLDEFEHVLRDCNPQQQQPGLYRFDRRDSTYLSTVAAGAGAQVVDPGGALKWAAEAGAPESIQPIPLGPLDEVLREYQKQGTYWMNFLSKNALCGILADEMGLGKTVQTLAFLQLQQGRSLVVCPSSLVLNWHREADRFAPELNAVTLVGSERRERFDEIAGARLVITSYALLRRDLEFYRNQEFTAIILDEAQHIKNPESQVAQATFALRARHRFALSGTPLENSVRDIWSLMNFLMPGYLGPHRDFRERFEVPIAAQPSGPEHRRLVQRLRPFILRRTKRAVASELPEKIEQTLAVELSDPQKSAYSAMARGAQQIIADLATAKRGRNQMAAFTMLLRLRQICLDLRLLGSEAEEKENASAKLELLRELIQDAIADGHRMLVFSQFAGMLKLIRDQLADDEIDCTYLDGSTRDRQAQVDRFQTGTVPVFLISLKAGGVGLNLTAADTVIHFDPWWNPAVEAQATDRVHRIGQARVVNVYKLIARGTVEEKILELQKLKRDIAADFLESDEPMMQNLSTEDLQTLLQ